MTPGPSAVTPAEIRPLVEVDRRDPLRGLPGSQAVGDGGELGEAAAAGVDRERHHHPVARRQLVEELPVRGERLVDRRHEGRAGQGDHIAGHLGRVGGIAHERARTGRDLVAEVRRDLVRVAGAAEPSPLPSCPARPPRPWILNPRPATQLLPLPHHICARQYVCG